MNDNEIIKKINEELEKMAEMRKKHLEQLATLNSELKALADRMEEGVKVLEAINKIRDYLKKGGLNDFQSSVQS